MSFIGNLDSSKRIKYTKQFNNNDFVFFFVHCVLPHLFIYPLLLFIILLFAVRFWSSLWNSSIYLLRLCFLCAKGMPDIATFIYLFSTQRWKVINESRKKVEEKIRNMADYSAIVKTMQHTKDTQFIMLLLVDGVFWFIRCALISCCRDLYRLENEYKFSVGPRQSNKFIYNILLHVFFFCAVCALWSSPMILFLLLLSLCSLFGICTV